MRIGSYALASPVILAPMAGITDAPYRRICLEQGAGLVVSEMVSARDDLRGTDLSRRRYEPDAWNPVPVVQLLGADPRAMAEAARYAQDAGFAVVDINFGCPARKVCGKACGSAIMGNEPLAREILEAVAKAVDVPVTVKMRTGWDGSHRNAIELAKAAEGAGFAAVTIHGRTREDLFRGTAEYRTIARAVRELSIPVVANGDIDGPQKALQVMKQTSAAGVMIGRAACGNPWLLGRIGTVLLGGADPGEPDRKTAGRTVLRHLRYHLKYWGEGLAAVRTFRKHAGWYLARFGGSGIAAELMKEQDAAAVCRMLEDFFEEGLRV